MAYAKKESVRGKIEKVSAELSNTKDELSIAIQENEKLEAVVKSLKIAAAANSKEISNLKRANTNIGNDLTKFKTKNNVIYLELEKLKETLKDHTKDNNALMDKNVKLQNTLDASEKLVGEQIVALAFIKGVINSFCAKKWYDRVVKIAWTKKSTTKFFSNKYM